MSKRILVVDDEKDLTDITCAMLSKSGFAVDAVNDPKEALVLIKQQHYGLLISDVHMPGMNGIELVKAAHKAQPRMETIIMSAYGTEATRDKCERLGLFGYLEKPIHWDVLADMAAKALASDRAMRLGYCNADPMLGFNRERILIADDNPHMCDILERLLSEKGYRISIVSNGSQAYEKILVNDYDLIILDINMPKMDGVEAVKAIREHDPYTYILLISGEAGSEDINQALKNGANHFIPKPFDHNELLKFIGEINFKKIDEMKHMETESEKTQAMHAIHPIRRFFSLYRLRYAGGNFKIIAAILILAIVLGATANFIADMSVSNAMSDDGIIMQKLDQLIKAVEMDWGR
ncbi:MAG: hypothetical protein A2268_02550 [Candidatus Raymondbacteria bacterium RifOxyA12_full_50_37]|uniref:Response regulatory domain-containing protein n=1 Tax=Candidatus Raymondbacteria bacterium RIFOXYD12_FULL_49_13 TaxID=1817890 RepID=A0A1F7FEN1_UNCRA|nr:MAG: hypothetical protein A2268_02550 [Candidatus Raymondbacteria bacterium RifOxyA12_full_50_37]OGJ89121.1 MAG: hypothetical protein A2248_11215 [Candidatus Raymondbacteria bacterium RIFOXYA2_FULL_49_16]OGJ96603.1 MAG: hypothetical protein A2453_06330 [Candidatus Raymondbacteria bacterium RIFOXYC2_FULL_50_21]OGK03182.1 MAG: hypothetical protein A2350_13905 [Candidatus Raymondbacteria bacterium RifOxyB12_full_50_8]OGK05159.1 MAG: hypothetical protein A2519_11470 [Candidatus Raymondbacteria b